MLEFPMQGKIRLSGISDALKVRVIQQLKVRNPEFDMNKASTIVHENGQSTTIVSEVPEFYELSELAPNGDLLVPRYWWCQELSAVGKPIWVPPDAGDFQHKICFPPREYQEIISKQLDVRATDCGLQLEPGFGKTYLSLYGAAKRKGRILITVPSVVKKDEWIEAIGSFMGYSPDQIGLVQGKTRNWKDKPVTVAVINTLAFQESFSEEFRNGFSSVIWDEAHLYTSPGMCKALGKINGVQMMLSATPGTGLRRKILALTAGNTWLTAPSPQLPVDVYFAMVNVSKYHATLDWRGLMMKLPNSKHYNDVLVHMVTTMREKGHPTMVATGQIRPLIKVRDAMGYGEFVIGAQSMKDQVLPRFPSIETHINTFEGRAFKAKMSGYLSWLKTTDLVLATATTKRMPGGTGFDYVRGSGMVVYHPIRSKDMCKQLLGRIRRLAEGKLRPECVVLVPNTAQGLKAKYAMERALNHIDGIRYKTIEQVY